MLDRTSSSAAEPEWGQKQDGGEPLAAERRAGRRWSGRRVDAGGGWAGEAVVGVW